MSQEDFDAGRCQRAFPGNDWDPFVRGRNEQFFREQRSKGNAGQSAPASTGGGGAAVGRGGGAGLLLLGFLVVAVAELLAMWTLLRVFAAS